MHDVMKRYLLFTYYATRPLGGAHDFLDSFDTVEDALENLLDEKNRYYQVVDSHSMAVVKQGLAWFKHFSPDHFRKHQPDLL